MKRKRLTAEQKVQILDEHISKSKIAETCREHSIHPNQFLQWKKKILEAGLTVLNGKARNKGDQREIERLREELAKKDNVIAKLAEENIGLKKQSGGL